MTVIRSREAERDIEQAAFWCEQQREGLGLELVLEPDAVLERVQTGARQFPEIEPRVRRALLRRFPYAVYLAGSAVVRFNNTLHPPRATDPFRCIGRTWFGAGG